METQPLVFIDSNYWIYLLDQKTEEHEAVKSHFDKIYSKFRFASNTVVLLEVMHYMVKRLGSKLAKDKWEWFMTLDLLIDELSISLLNKSFDALLEYSVTGIGSRDASIIASMERLGEIKILFTHDHAFLKIPDLEVIDAVTKA